MDFAEPHPESRYDQKESEKFVAPQAYGVSGSLSHEVLSVINYIVYMSIVLQAGSYYFKDECWANYSEETMHAKRFLRMEFFQLIFFLWAVPAWQAWKWLNANIGNGIRFEIVWNSMVSV